MKIAIITDDEKTISQYFGRANYYAVLTIENGQIVQREIREKLGQKYFSNELQEYLSDSDPQHGFDPASQSHYEQMSQTITDCEALICGGMGAGAYESTKERGIRPIITDIEDIDIAALDYASGILANHVEKLH